MSRLVHGFFAAALLVLAASIAHAQGTATFHLDASWTEESCGTKAEKDERILGVVADIDPTIDTKLKDAFANHLLSKNTYSITSDWRDAGNVLDKNGDHPPFQINRILLRTNSAGAHRVCLFGSSTGKTSGEIHVAPLDGWKFATKGGSNDSAVVRYTFDSKVEVPKPTKKIQIGVGSGGPTLEANYSGVTSATDADGITSLSLAGRFPLGTPKDVARTPGAKADASGQVADFLSVDWSNFQYSRGWGLRRFGARARATGSGDGLELTGYLSPVASNFDNLRAFFGAEAEAGYRRGDAEYKTLTTQAPNRGHLVARLGAVAEWAPSIFGLVNKDLSRGLRFFVRGRAWLDTYDNDYGQRSVRLVPFLDSEVFYNFDKESRVFFRLEYGSLPPDLTRRISRVFVGVGQAF
jgi:hypothetical protein